MTTRLQLETDNFLHTNPALYEAFNGEHDQSMAHFIHKLLAHYRPGSRVLDIGSGLGREVAFLREAGYDAVGLDNSEAMLTWARDRYPGVPFHYGEQADFSLGQSFDALYCVGSTFLYNFTNEAIQASLHCFKNHLREGGLLYLDMRNAAFFLTREGQRWLTEELAEQRIFEGRPVSLRTRFSLNLPAQLLLRDYCWSVAEDVPITEHLQHRLLFPQELAQHLHTAGFRLLQLFDQPAPHTHADAAAGDLSFTDALTGRRLQVIAQAV
ncbi:class I SAM-dependent methyltransferase [Paenibacillus daejeonensis]|uniref:class I SAM-dependent methyltransferase n=1 Tax=Paenibacillus daejeonensis TaxID=135193 RepID=UPI00037DA0E3|nr:class I SAM-dependent methyltransferase [Paenibacillus daejeonensis]